MHCTPPKFLVLLLIANMVGSSREQQPKQLCLAVANNHLTLKFRVEARNPLIVRVACRCPVVIMGEAAEDHHGLTTPHFPW